MCHAPMTLLPSLARSLSDNAICGVSRRGRGTYTTEGITALCEGLKGSAVTSLDVADNNLDDAAKQALRAAVGSGVNLSM